MDRITLLLLAILILSSGCAQQETPEMPKTLKGVSISPRSFEGDDFTSFFEEARESGNTVIWAGDWDHLDNISEVMHGLSSTYGYTPLLEVTYYTQGEGELIRPLTEEMKERYKNSAVAYAERYEPRYFGIGIEVNVMAEKSPEDFEEFVLFYNEVYDAVKEKSPDTKVFTVFQLEKMKGMTFWSETSYAPGKAQWGLIDRFKTDMVAFSTYPGLVYKDPSDIPADHYTEIRSHVSKPIAFTEIGWHAAASPAGWESSDTEQAEFIATFFDLTKDLDVEIVIWSFMYDPGTIEPFSTMGLRRSDGTARPAWDAWIRGGD